MLSCRSEILIIFLLIVFSGVIIWCYHLLLSSEMITPPFFIIIENVTHSHFPHIDLCAPFTCSIFANILGGWSRHYQFPKKPRVQKSHATFSLRLVRVHLIWLGTKDTASACMYLMANYDKTWRELYVILHHSQDHCSSTYFILPVCHPVPDQHHHGRSCPPIGQPLVTWRRLGLQY